MATWPTLSSDHPLLTFHSSLSSIISNASHSQIWGVTLDPSTPPPFSTLVILQKFLRANTGDVDKAKEQLEKTLKWRKEFGVDEEEWESKVPTDEGFKGLGFVTHVRNKEGSEPSVVTWNVYGAVKDDPNVAFGDLDEFLRWRIDLMEQGIKQLHLDKATTPIPDYSATEEPGQDPYQIYQVHDYLSVSFLRPSPSVSAASKATIALMRENYPELLAKKYFVNVPYIMGWMFSAASLLVAKKTLAKFNILANGTSLGDDLGGKQDLPTEYGGTGKSLEESNLVRIQNKKTEA